MYARPITYIDFDDVERTETYYFNISERELIALDNNEPGGLQKKLAKILEFKDETALMNVFEFFILASYGEKSDDGRKFIKRDGQLAAEFKESAAYNALFLDLIRNPNAAAEFVRSILPKKLIEEAAAELTVVE